MEQQQHKLQYESPREWSPSMGESMWVLFLLCLLPFVVVIGIGIGVWVLVQKFL